MGPLRIAALGVFVGFAVLTSLPAQAMTPERLRCEALINPLGIDEPAPQFDWRVSSHERGARQTAYRLLVATDAKLLKAGTGDLWDSGRVESNATFGIAYAGKPLASRQRAHWTVEVWDEHGRGTKSKPAWFEMGLLASGDWKANWVSLPPPPGPEGRPEWIWTNEPTLPKEAPSGTRWLRKRFDLPASVASARLGIAVDDSFEATLNGQPLARGEDWRRYVKVDPKPLLKYGTNEIVIKGTNVAGPAGAAVLGEIILVDGRRVSLLSDGSWEASRDGKAWEPALAFAKMGEAPYTDVKFNDESLPAPHLRRDFAVRGKVRRARAYATARGVYELTIDGHRVGDRLFAPGDVDYRKRQPYNAYDVTGRLTPGKHAVGLTLGEGWYSGHVGWSGREAYGPYPDGLVQIEIEYADGTTETIASDEKWRGAAGAILGSDILMGETFDARKEPRGWDRPGFDPSAWKSVEAKPLDAVPFVMAKAPPVEWVGEIKPISLHEVQPGVYVYDLGQNMVGWARLRVQGQPGTRVRMRFAEMLNPDGTIYTTNLRGAKQTDEYVLDGRGNETYEPRFTFHGFRYVEVTGYPGQPGRDAITGIVASSATPIASEFACSNELVNQLDHNIRWGQRGNYLEIPTDCPQRDERLGWMADAQVFTPTAAYNADIQAFMTKWLDDVRDSQSAEGAFPDVAPRIVDLNDGAPAWADAGVIVPWTMYEFYGDRRLLERNYPAMRAWVDHLDRNNPEHLWLNVRHNDFGDWLSVDADTPKELLATAYFARSTELVAKAARVLGKDDEASRYETLHRKIVEAFRRAYVEADGRIKGDTQTAYILPLAFGLLTPEMAEKARDHLVDNILVRKNGHLSTGFLGVGWINPTLTAIGRSDVAYRLLLNDTFPSWGFSIRHGATTIWERWDGWTPEKGFQDPGMNSFNHYSLGSVGEWMMASVLGIGRDSQVAGFRRLVIRPEVGGPLTWAKGRYDAITGRIATSWRKSGDELHLDVEIPANTTAVVYVPCRNVENVREGEGPAGLAPGVRFLRAEPGAAVFEIGGGKYRFRSSL